MKLSLIFSKRMNKISKNKMAYINGFCHAFGHVAASILAAIYLPGSINQL